MKRVKSYLSRLFNRAQTPSRTAHPEDRKAWRDAVAEMAGREDDLLEDFGPELARMVLVYPAASAEEMLSALREHVWLGYWKPRKKPTPKRSGAR